MWTVEGNASPGRSVLVDGAWGPFLEAPGNRPFYSCVLSYPAMNASEAGGDLALIETSQLFSCK